VARRWDKIFPPRDLKAEVLAAGVVGRPEISKRTSIKHRVDHAQARGVIEALRPAELGSVTG